MICALRRGWRHWLRDGRGARQGRGLLRAPRPKSSILFIRDAGVEDLEIYLLGTRLCMIMEVNEEFSFEAKAAADQANPRVREWEELMWHYQKPLPQAKSGEKWIIMDRIFKLEK